MVMLVWDRLILDGCYSAKHVEIQLRIFNGPDCILNQVDGRFGDPGRFGLVIYRIGFVRLPQTFLAFRKKL